MTKDIAALVGSRICHDLISPLGAIGNGVELLSLTSGETSAEMMLINESIANANARIRFFRIAYGAAEMGQRISRKEILSVLSASAQGGRFTYFWHPEGDQSRREVRIAFLLLQCLEAALPSGGEISVTQDAGTWEVTGLGSRVHIDEDLWHGLKEPKGLNGCSPAHVQFAVLPSVLTEARRRLDIDISETRVRVRF